MKLPHGESYRLPGGVYLEHECMSYGVKGPSSLLGIQRGLSKVLDAAIQNGSESLFVEFDGVEYMSGCYARDLVKSLFAELQLSILRGVRIIARRMNVHVRLNMEQALADEDLILLVEESGSKHLSLVGNLEPELQQCFEALSRQVQATAQELAKIMQSNRSTIANRLKRLLDRGLICKLESRGLRREIYATMVISQHELINDMLRKCYETICLRALTAGELATVIGKQKSSAKFYLKTLCDLRLICKDEHIGTDRAYRYYAVGKL